MIGKTQRLPLREVWKHEAHDFTAWLMDNIDVLSGTIKISLQNVERERSAGDFSADLVADDGEGRVYENWLHKRARVHRGEGWGNAYS